MKVGRLEVFCGGMFAEKSTNLQRQFKRHLLAGKKVVMFKPMIDTRYGENVASTHDGSTVKAINVFFDAEHNYVDDITSHPAVDGAEAICIDEVQFFPKLIVQYIDELLYAGINVYVAGLDMDSNGVPFETTMLLMGKAEEVTKYQAVCQDCGNDAWVTVNENKKDRVAVGNDGYKPVCRSCSVKYIGGGLND